MIMKVLLIFWVLLQIEMTDILVFDFSSICDLQLFESFGNGLSIHYSNVMGCRMFDRYKY